MHCGIFFMAHPRNAGRRDIRCPFGCRKAHRKRSAAQRSAEYYRTPDGRAQKRSYNAMRRKDFPWPDDLGLPEEGAAAALPPRARICLLPDGRKIGEEMVAYVRMVTSLIEGRRVSREEVVQMLARVVRQRSIARRRRIDQIIVSLNEIPP